VSALDDFLAAHDECCDREGMGEHCPPDAIAARAELAALRARAAQRDEAVAILRLLHNCSEYGGVFRMNDLGDFLEKHDARV